MGLEPQRRVAQHPGLSTWQFNFKFSLAQDTYAQDSIDLLTNSGILFRRHSEEGIDHYELTQLLMTSGVVLSDDVKWLSFHGGYDFGYMLKLLTDQELPSDKSEFFEQLRIYFPAIYDVKYLMKSCRNIRGGLQEVADQLALERIGPQHQAGSDSLLTGATFFRLRDMFFEGNIDDAKYCGHLYGLGPSCEVNGNSYYEEASYNTVDTVIGAAQTVVSSVIASTSGGESRTASSAGHLTRTSGSLF